MPIRMFCKLQIPSKRKFCFALLVTLLLGVALTSIKSIKPHVKFIRKGNFPEELWMFNINDSQNQFNGKSIRERYIHQVKYIPHNIKEARASNRSQTHRSLTPVVILVADVMGQVYYKDFN